MRKVSRHMCMPCRDSERDSRRIMRIEVRQTEEMLALDGYAVLCWCSWYRQQGDCSRKPRITAVAASAWVSTRPRFTCVQTGGNTGQLETASQLGPHLQFSLPSYSLHAGRVGVHSSSKWHSEKEPLLVSVSIRPRTRPFRPRQRSYWNLMKSSVERRESQA